MVEFLCDNVDLGSTFITLSFTSFVSIGNRVQLLAMIYIALEGDILATVITGNLGLRLVSNFSDLVSICIFYFILIVLNS